MTITFNTDLQTWVISGESLTLDSPTLTFSNPFEPQAIKKLKKKPLPEPKFKPGDKVSHKTYGTGTVECREVQDYLIEFDNEHPKLYPQGYQTPKKYGWFHESSLTEADPYNDGLDNWE